MEREIPWWPQGLAQDLPLGKPIADLMRKQQMDSGQKPTHAVISLRGFHIWQHSLDSREKLFGLGVRMVKRMTQSQHHVYVQFLRKLKGNNYPTSPSHLAFLDPQAYLGGKEGNLKQHSTPHNDSNVCSKCGNSAPWQLVILPPLYLVAGVHLGVPAFHSPSQFPGLNAASQYRMLSHHAFLKRI